MRDFGTTVHAPNPLIYTKECTAALDGVAQWTECWTANQRVAGSIPSQGTCLGCGPGAQ